MTGPTVEKVARVTLLACAATLAAYGGNFIVRGGKLETLEGEWSPERFVIIEFPSTDQAKAWWGSMAYAEAKALRQATSASEMIVVEGV